MLNFRKMNQLTPLIAAGIFSIFVSCNNPSSKEEENHGEMHEAHNGEAHDDHQHDNNHDHQHDNNHDHHNMAADQSHGSVKSPRKAAMANIGATHVHVDYAAPSMRGREIFGGLVGYDQVWTPGAHKATTVQFYGDVIVEGKEIAKGKYGLFTIPGKDKWTIMINKNNDMHLADNYNESEDVLRFEVTPEKLQEPVEQLTFEVKSEEGKKGKVVLKWADTKVSFNVESKS